MGQVKHPKVQLERLAAAAAAATTPSASTNCQKSPLGIEKLRG
jgi:hypothetical protein